jgi:nucleotide-binding universal stress UspA family protein
MRAQHNHVDLVGGCVPDDYGVNFDQVVKVGNPDEKILETVENENANLIILGTHGRSGISRAFTGSVAEKVMRNSDTPVMTVREFAANSDGHEARRILVPVDFSVFGYAALDYATKLALSIDANLTIVCVDETASSASRQFPNGRPEWSDSRKKTWEQLKKFVPASERVDFTHKLLTGDAATAINEYANTNNYDFIVLGTHGRTGLGRAIMGSVAESVVRHANCPVISVKPSNKRTAVLR